MLTKSQQSIYLAGPMSGLPRDVLLAEYKKLTKTLTPYYKIFNPMMRHELFEANTEIVEERSEYNIEKAFYRRDRWMVQQSDIVFIDFSRGLDTKVSIGSCFELAWAYEFGKHTVVVINQPHDHAFVHMASDIIFNSQTSALEYLKDMAMEEI